MTESLEISSAYPRLILQSGLLPAGELLRGTGTSLEFLRSTDYIGWQILADILHNIGRYTGEADAWAARLGAQFSVSAHGSLGFAALSAPTLGAAFEALVEFYPSRVKAIKMELIQHHGVYAICVSDVTGDGAFTYYLAEIIMKVAESLLAAILGHPASDNIVVRLMRHEPEDASQFHEVFAARVLFGENENSISIPESWWRLPSPLHDESVYRANSAKCREIITARAQHSSAPAIVRARLKNHFDLQISGELRYEAPPTQTEIAHAMHVTTRTLIRHLQKDNVSYKNILEELRREYAQTLLSNARLTVADVGEILGYAEPANFGRAFRRWFDCSPAVWRHIGAVGK